MRGRRDEHRSDPGRSTPRSAGACVGWWGGGGRVTGTPLLTFSTSRCLTWLPACLPARPPAPAGGCAEPGAGCGCECGVRGGGEHAGAARVCVSVLVCLVIAYAWLPGVCTAVWSLPAAGGRQYRRLSHLSCPLTDPGCHQAGSRPHTRRLITSLLTLLPFFLTFFPAGAQGQRPGGEQLAGPGGGGSCQYRAVPGILPGVQPGMVQYCLAVRRHAPLLATARRDTPRPLLTVPMSRQQGAPADGCCC